MKLRNIRNVGRYVDSNTNKSYNVKKGDRVGRATSHYYYLFRGSRVLINDKDFFDNYEKIK